MKPVWLDCDPGHDDATAILLALHCPNVNLLGVSTTHGNAGHENTAINAARCLFAFGAPAHVLVYPGAKQPLILPTRHDPEIHGDDGLGGVIGLPPGDDPRVVSFFATDAEGEPIRALDGMSKHIRTTWNKGRGLKVTVISTGPMTNIALFVSVYPELLDAVEEFVFMGGGVGMGNRSAVAEYNIMCDPHAAQIVLDAPIRAVMIPINVTHTAIATRQVRWELLSPSLPMHQDPSIPFKFPKATTNLRYTLFTLLNFFAETYDSTFGFKDGPPLHDALAIGYVSQPELFRTKRYRVDVELGGTHCIGETVVDVWNYLNCDDTWGPGGKNCLVAEALEVDGFFSLFQSCVGKCDAVSPLNQTKTLFGA